MDLTLQKNEPKVNPSFFEVVLVDILSQLLGETEEKDSEPEVVNIFSETEFRRHYKLLYTCIYNSYTQDIHKIKPAKENSVDGWWGHNVQALSMELLATNGRERRVSFLQGRH